MYHRLLVASAPFFLTLSGPSRALLQELVQLLVTGVVLTHWKPLEGRDRLLPVAAALVHARLADLHDLAPQVNLLEDVVHGEDVRADATMMRR